MNPLPFFVYVRFPDNRSPPRQRHSCNPRESLGGRKCSGEQSRISRHRSFPATQYARGLASKVPPCWQCYPEIRFPFWSHPTTMPGHVLVSGRCKGCCSGSALAIFADIASRPSCVCLLHCAFATRHFFSLRSQELALSIALGA